ncbi:MAG TPA: 5-oxoprolinase subunit PxpB [Chthoniobacterales bacterium]|nr:5-oxoprolinase subunit PxpB [Chthoniobacterales bacterium]
MRDPSLRSGLHRWQALLSKRYELQGELAHHSREDRHLLLRKYDAQMEITPLGDSALIVRVAESFESAPDETLSAVLAVQRRLETAQLPGVIEIAPAYTTVAVFFDPTRVVSGGAEPDRLFDSLAERIREALSDTLEGHHRLESRLIEVPVCYEAEFALDLEDVARRAGVHWKEVVDLHCSAEYRVHCLGFTPGFPFLGGLPGKLATPRRSTPRKEIPAGSVAIGGAQTGIYPIKSPGGWNVIGRTPLRLFDPVKSPPALLRTGDRVRFRAITREDFDRVAK